MKSVLLVDDDKILLTVLSSLLRGAGLQVHPAADVHQAIRLLKQQQFDLIVTDANMPSLSGFDLLEIIKRNDESYGYPKVIMLTGLSGKRDEEHARLWGADKFITKPVDPVYIRDLVIQMLELTHVMMIKQGIEVSEVARWTGAFEIKQIFEDHVVFRSPVPLEQESQITIGSALLNAISPSFSKIEVTACEDDGDGRGFTVTAKFNSISVQDLERMRDWIDQERNAA